MSAAEMTANAGKVSAGVAKLVDDAISDLHRAQRLVQDLQRELAPTVFGIREKKVIDADAIWHRLETIDDRIHEALARLGD